ncbi:histidine kinase [Neobacillus sp. 179-C4.2 HS]|uniref:Histidine kinase n=1 Tax=Neobacillus driksii TaxID=3035913 RepID=A0ABV4YUQ3_9BACI|nr:histidine kinase [Neobacillus sp. 179.-C4.2 HS]MDP5192646.1 histidine kinase [Neobacillus sp. 179.-C4.2 HS]
MKMKNFKSIYNSISFKIIFYIIIILTPLISLLIYNIYQTHESLLKQVEGTHKNMLQSYLTQIDTQLKNSMNYTLDMALFQSDPKILVSEPDDTDVVFAKYRIFTSLSNRLLSTNQIDAYFIYVRNGDYFISATQHGVSSSELNELKRYVLANSELTGSSNNFPKSTWTSTTIDKHNSLINLSYGNGDIIAGAYTSTDRIKNEFTRKNFITAKLLFLPSASLNEVIDKQPKDHVVITSKSSVADILLIEVLSKSVILQSLPFIQKYILLVSIFLALMLPLLILLMNVTIVKPLRKLTKSLGRVRVGDLKYRIDLHRSSNEFEIVNSTFNEMMDTVQNLKINVYEEQIKVQKSQLRNLQLQINPHFLINSLNMVNNLIQNEDSATAKKLILYSVDYFRYMAKADNDFVPLYEEINHIKDYLEIQKIRYKDKFTYSIDVNQLIEDMLIPPMLIQNFVENSIKYAIDMNKVIHLSVKVEYFEVDYYPYAKIVISDSGIGYPTDSLKLINSGKKIIDSLGDHIGIFNSVQRVKILYNGKGSWKFYNDGGAVSELRVPALFDDQLT